MKAWILFFIMCSASAAFAEAPKTSGAEPAMVQYENVFLSGPPSVADLKKFKAAGGEVVVDLREFEEKSKDCGEVVTITKLGLKYKAVPMPKVAPLTEQTVRQVEEALTAAQGKPVLIHCSTGQRAAAWLAIHLAQEKSLSSEEAVKVAQTKGLTSDHMQEAVKDYLSSH